MKRLAFACILLLGLSNVANASRSDSLISILEKTKDDSVKAFLLNAIAWELKYSDQEQALDYANRALKLATKNKLSTTIADAGNTIGVVNFLQGNYNEAKTFLEDALKIRQRLNDQTGVAKIYNNLGLIASAQNDYPSAIEYYMNSLKVADEQKNDAGVASSYNNIGNVYVAQENYEKALDYFERSLTINRKLGDRMNQAANLNNIGSIYSSKQEFPSALRYYREALDILRKEENKKEEFNALQNIGNTYMNLNQYDSALFYLNHALDGKNSLEDPQRVPGILLNLGYIYQLKKNNDRALSYMSQSLQEAEDQENLDEIKEACKGLADVYESMNDYKKSYAFYKRYILLKDSVFDSATMDKIADFQTLYETEKRDKEILVLNKDKQIQSATIQKQKIVQRAIIGGFIGALIFLIVVFFQKRKINAERRRSEELLLNILPADTAEELKATGKAKTKYYEQVSVLFTDFKNFTKASEVLSPEELVEEINFCYSSFDEILSEHGMEKIKTIGDAYMCAGGIPMLNTSNAIDAVNVALKISRFMNDLKELRIKEGKSFFEIRIGIHTGPVVAGVVGKRKFAYDIWGDTVNIASRMESSGEAGKINISDATYEFIKDKFRCTYRGNIEAKNKGLIKMYFVEG